MGFSIGGALGGLGLNTLTGGLGGFASDLFGTKQGTVPYTNTQQSTFNPFAASYLPGAFNQAQSVFKSTTPNFGLTGSAQGLANKTIAGDYLTPDSNPYLRSSVQDALGLAGSAFAGQYGGSAGTNLGNSGYQEGLARTLGQVATNAYSNAYGQERQNQQSAMGLAPSLDYAAASAPYLGIQNYLATLQPGLAFGTTNSTGQNQQPYFQNNTATTLGALAGGAGLLKMFG